MDLSGLVLSLAECWSVRIQLNDRLNEAMKRIKELEDHISSLKAPEN